MNRRAFMAALAGAAVAPKAATFTVAELRQLRHMLHATTGKTFRFVVYTDYIGPSYSMTQERAAATLEWWQKINGAFRLEEEPHTSLAAPHTPDS